MSFNEIAKKYNLTISTIKLTISKFDRYLKKGVPKQSPYILFFKKEDFYQ